MKRTGGELGEPTEEDLLWERAGHFAWFAERFGWTPDQVEAQPIWYITRLPAIIQDMDRTKREREKEAQG